MATFGVASTFSLTPPQGYVQESSSEYSCEVATIRDSDGDIVEAIHKPLITRTVMIRTKGEVDLVPVHQGAISGTLVVTSSKVSESNDDFAMSEVTANSYA